MLMRVRMEMRPPRLVPSEKSLGTFLKMSILRTRSPIVIAIDSYYLWNQKVRKIMREVRLSCLCVELGWKGFEFVEVEMGG